MRRSARLLLAATLAGASALLPVVPLAPALAQGALPPHAWLFGAWTGGIFPAPSNLTAESCLAQPTVFFTRDVVLRSTLTDQTYTQRVVATARAVPGGEEFTFSPAANPQTTAASGLLGISAPPPATGFGCESADVLHVQRHGENEIVFPNCADFPNPLIRCPAR